MLWVCEKPFTFFNERNPDSLTLVNFWESVHNYILYTPFTRLKLHTRCLLSLRPVLIKVFSLSLAVLLVFMHVLCECMLAYGSKCKFCVSVSSKFQIITKFKHQLLWDSCTFYLCLAETNPYFHQPQMRGNNKHRFVSVIPHHNQSWGPNNVMLEKT